MAPDVVTAVRWLMAANPHGTPPSPGEVLARELGSPAAVAARGCTSVLKAGDLIEVDGSAGVVRVLERA